MERQESFPCIICGGVLWRAGPEEGQPDDGIMCQSYGNYGSTVYDPMDYSYLAFNICDDCLVRAGKQGRVWSTRIKAPVQVHGLGLVGTTRCERPYVQWHKGLAGDDAGITLDVEELDTYADRIEWHIPIEDIKGFLARRQE